MTMWDELVAAWHPADPWRPDEAGVRRYYETKYQIVGQLNPRSICEIGVRAGYSAFMFLHACPQAEYLGIDLGTFHATDINEASMFAVHAEKILAGRNGSILWHNSQRMSGIPATKTGGPFNFVYVDADHSYKGCTHDLLIATNMARWVLVDDFDIGPEVRAACRDFLLSHPGWSAEYVPDGYRGNLLLERSGAAYGSNSL